MKPASLSFAVTVGLLGASWGFVALSEIRKEEPLAIPLNAIESRIDGWEGVDDGPLAPRVIESLHATSYLSRTYRKGRNEIGLFIAFYAYQRAGETMHSPKHCLPGAGWEIIRSGSVPLTLNGREVFVDKYGIQRGTSRDTVLYWYQSRDRIIRNEYSGKMWLVWDAMRHNSTAAAIVRVIITDNPAAEKEGRSFASHLVAEMQRCFGG